MEYTIENAALNHVDNILVRLGDASLLADQRFNVILANIQRNIILQDMVAYRNVLSPGGMLLMSGFYTADLEAIEEKAISLGLKLNRTYERSNWCTAGFSL